MRVKKTGLTLVLLLAGLLFQAQGQSARADASQYVGKYSFAWMFGGESITLNADGTFVRGSGGCTNSTEQFGTYQFSGGLLRFKISKVIGKNNGDDKEFDLFDAKARRKFLNYADDEKDDAPPEKEFSIYPIGWGTRIYLVYERGLEGFAHAINLGWEPRGSDPQYEYYGTYLLREGDEDKTPSGKPSLPEQYQRLILAEPITATIVSIQPADKDTDQIATIDKGRLAGVMVGLRLIKTGEESRARREGVVISVEDTYAKVRVVPNHLVGETLTTRFERRTQH